MSENQAETKEHEPDPATAKVLATTETFRDFLETQLGRIFLVANPESFEETAIGHEITPDWYRAKLIGLGADYLIVLTEFAHGTGKRAEKEIVKQFIPLHRIKRISLMRSERFLHI